MGPERPYTKYWTKSDTLAKIVVFRNVVATLPKESPEALILKVSLTTLTLSRLMSLLDSLTHLIEGRFHYDFMRLYDLCQIFKQ